MWPFGPAPRTSSWVPTAEEEELEAEDAHAEAEELRLKLEALRAADYREQLRASCTASATALEGAADRRCHPRAGNSGGCDGSGCGSRLDPPADLADGEAATARRLRIVEVKLHERGEVLEAQLEAQERKLAAASRALQRARGQVQQLNAHLGLEKLHGSRLECQVTQLRNLLVEKERRLQEALDEAARSNSGRLLPSAREVAAPPPGAEPAAEAAAEEGSSSDSQENGAQQPQEPPVACAAPPAAGVVGSAQLQQLAQVTEGLTEALEAAREGECDARRQLAEVTAQLQAECRWRAQRECDFAAAEERRDAEVAALRTFAAAQEQRMAAELARARVSEEREARVKFEERLQQALAQKKGRGQWHPHLEI